MIAASEAAGLAQRPPPIYLEGKLPVIEAAMARQLGLRNEQVVQANVESQAGHWWLRFQSGSGVALPRDWPAPFRLMAGDSLFFKVLVQADGSILLKPLTDAALAQQPAQAASAPTPSGPLLPDRLSQLLVRPQDMKALQDLLQPGALEQLARQVGEWPGPLAQWLRLRPSMGQLNAEQLRAWWIQSGWFNEGLLGSGRSAPLADLKSALRALQRSMQQNQDGQVRWVDEAIDDLESGQVALLQSSATSGDVAGGVLMAFRDMPPVRLTIRREGYPQEEGGASFVVDVEMQTHDLGPVWLRTRISDTATLDLTMWAARSDVVNLAKSQAGTLREQLTQAGLRLQSLQILHGQAPTSPAESTVDRPPGQVLDVRT